MPDTGRWNHANIGADETTCIVGDCGVNPVSLSSRAPHAFGTSSKQVESETISFPCYVTIRIKSSAGLHFKNNWSPPIGTRPEVAPRVARALRWSAPHREP